MTNKNRRKLNILDCYEKAPFLHLNTHRIYKEMGEIYWNLSVETLFIRLYVSTSQNPAWQEVDIADDYPDFEAVTRIILMLKTQRHEKPHLYDLLQEAVQVPYERNINDLFDEIEAIWEHGKAGTFLAIVADIIWTIIYFKGQASPGANSAEDSLMAEAMPKPPDKILA
jgi:hypothetical protein